MAAERQLPYAITQFEIDVLVPINALGIDVSFTTSAQAMVTTMFFVGAYLLIAMRERAIIPGRMQVSAEAIYVFIARAVIKTAGPAAAPALLPLVAVALALGKIFADWISSVAPNPSAAETVQPIGLLGFALTEAIALFALIVAFIIIFVG
jgi:F0F1-type ATP synthase membrane subunit c/vacuolar-type H+-ATPase subunit K